MLTYIVGKKENWKQIIEKELKTEGRDWPLSVERTFELAMALTRMERAKIPRAGRPQAKRMRTGDDDYWKQFEDISDIEK